MYDIDRPKFVLVSLLEDFIRETEHSLAYFFAILIFLLTFLLALFGREALYTGLVGVLCLLLIKLRDIIEGFKETRQNILFYASNEKQSSVKGLNDAYTSFDDASLTTMAKEFPKRFNQTEQSSALEKSDLLSYLRTILKIIETVGFFVPDKPFRPETRQAVLKMTLTAQKYLLRYLKRKYALTKERLKTVEQTYSRPVPDFFLLRTQLEVAGVDKKNAYWIVSVLELLHKIKNRVDTRSADDREIQTDQVASDDQKAS